MLVCCTSLLSVCMWGWNLEKDRGAHLITGLSFFSGGTRLSWITLEGRQVESDHKPQCP